MPEPSDTGLPTDSNPRAVHLQDTPSYLIDGLFITYQNRSLYRFSAFRDDQLFDSTGTWLESTRTFTFNVEMEPTVLLGVSSLLNRIVRLTYENGDLTEDAFKLWQSNSEIKKSGANEPAIP